VVGGAPAAVKSNFDDALGWMRSGERRLPSPNLGEEVGGAQIQVVLAVRGTRGSIVCRSDQRAVLTRMHSR